MSVKRLLLARSQFKSGLQKWSTLSLNVVENIFWTNKKMFSCPPSITKTKISRIGIRIFGGSDVVNKLLQTAFCMPKMAVNSRFTELFVLRNNAVKS